MLLAAATAAIFALAGLLAFARTQISHRPQVPSASAPRGLAPPASNPTRGIDISYPQCGRALGDMPNGFVIVGVNGGKPMTVNPCLAQQWSFASRQAGRAVYLNTADTGRGDPADYAERIVNHALRAMSKVGVPKGTPVWLDVETLNTWRGTQARHARLLEEMTWSLWGAGYPVGVYAARSHWAEITGDVRPIVPVGLAVGAVSAQVASRQCGAVAFGDVRASLVQRVGTGSDGTPLDRNVVCPGTSLRGLISGS